MAGFTLHYRRPKPVPAQARPRASSFFNEQSNDSAGRIFSSINTGIYGCMAHVRVVPIRKISNAEMKRKTSSAKLLDKNHWNHRPVIDLTSRAIRESGGSFLLVLGPTFSALLANKSLLTNAVGYSAHSIIIPAR